MSRRAVFQSCCDAAISNGVRPCASRPFGSTCLARHKLISGVSPMVVARTNASAEIEMGWGSGAIAIALMSVGMPVERYLARHGRPIRYRHSPDGLGIEAYQTVFARDPGSAEMPSAARPFSEWQIISHQKHRHRGNPKPKRGPAAPSAVAHQIGIRSPRDEPILYGGELRKL